MSETENVPVYVTKYCLSTGKIARRTKYVRSSLGGIRYRDEKDYDVYILGKGRDYHVGEQEAVQRAEKMRSVKIASLQKQIAKLERLMFVVEDADHD